MSQNTNTETQTPAPSESDFAGGSEVDFDQVEQDLIAIGVDSKPQEVGAEGTQAAATGDQPVGEPKPEVTNVPPAAPQTQQAAPTEQVVETAPPVQTPVVSPTPEAVQPPAQVQQPQAVDPATQQQPAVAAPQGQVAGSVGNPLDQLASEVEANKAALETMLAERVYALSEEQKNELDINPAQAIPKLMAKMHLEITQSLLASVASNIPATIQNVMRAETVQREREERFFQRWPQLDRKKHGQVIEGIARNYAQMNPRADEKTRIEQIGAMAVVQLGLLPAAQPQVAQQQVQRAPAFAPAVGGVSAPAPVSSNPNPFAQMYELMEIDDRV